MKSNIFIPKKIKVGFNLRTDTYTGKLGYVIYHDGKVWRKEASWESWRYKYVDPTEFEIAKKKSFDDAVKKAKENHKYYIEMESKQATTGYYTKYAKMTEDEFLKDSKVNSYNTYSYHPGNQSDDEGIIPLEFDNTPLEGFVLNKKVGGYKSDWNFRQAYTRVYDPRGFEFEITIPNLLYILENANSIKGKGLEGKFIYGWDGKDLVLIPEEAPEYKEMVEFTDTLSLKVSKKDLIVGGIYLTSSGEKVTYLTEAPVYDYKGIKTANKALWFHNGEKSYNYFDTRDISTIKKFVEENDNFVSLRDELDHQLGFKPKTALIYKYELYVPSEIKFRDSYYGNDIDVFIPAKEKGKYKLVCLNKDYYHNNKFYLKKGRRGETFTELFSSLDKLIETHPIYKRTTENEKTN